MTKLGWIILATILLAGAAFASMVSFGPGRPSPVARSSRSAGSPEGEASALVVPVAGYSRNALRDSWGEARGGGTRAHHGTDIPAPAGSRVVAAATGTVEKLFESRLGGTTLYVRSPDRRSLYYYAHLAGYAPGVREGLQVKRGDLLGFVGDTGDAGPGNYHLHFSVQRMHSGDRWWQGEDINPYPLLAGASAVR